MTPTVLETPCREWQGPVAGKGYGYRYIRGRGMMYVHRWVWEQINGPIPKGMVVMHLCDNPRCFRYDHLRVGTVADNNADMGAKGRRRGGRPNAAKTHCPAGHPYDEENTMHFTDSRGSQCRTCRACNRQRCHEAYQRRRKAK